LGRKAVFLDRDGTINVASGYVKKTNEFKLYQFAGEAIRKLNDSNYLVIVVTNQSGINRGYYTEETLDLIHKKMRKELKKSGAYINKIYYCPSKPEENSIRRKPQPGMIFEAKKEFAIDLKESYIIGDKITDIQLGLTSGVNPILVKTGEGQESIKLLDIISRKKQIIVKKNLLKAVNYILEIE